MANKVYVNPETPVTFGPSSAEDVAFGLTSLAAAAGRVSDQFDLGAGARSEWYEWRAKSKFVTAPVIGEIIELYLATSDGAIVDGNVGTADAALATGDKRKNLHLIGWIVVDKADATEPMYASGVCRIDARYLSAVWWNGSTKALSGTDGDHEFILTAIPPEVQ